MTSSAACPEDTAFLPQAESSDEEMDVFVSDSDCQVCRNFRIPNSTPIKTTYAKLRRTATDGCELCKLLQQVSEIACTGENTVIRDTDEVHASTECSGVEQRAAHLDVRRPRRDGYWLYYHAMFYAASGDSCPWPFMRPNYIPDESASIQDCVPSIRRMLDTCDTSHTTCKANDPRLISRGLVTPQFIPKRLLHVSGDCVPLQVHLYETMSDETSLKAADIRYTALSHCWGSTPVIKTTTDTISGFKTEGINWLHLSKTFQEAILLTRELGIDYIWVDSLCILQDSVDDWAHQASQMADVFSNAYLTIAASAAKNGQQGLLNRRRSLRKVEASHNDETFVVCVRGSISHEFIASCDLPFAFPTDLPLRRRAWCLQEELLSRRIVHFTADEMVFVCRAATTCECDPRWVPRFPLPQVIGHDPADDHPECIWYADPEVWNNIVAHYTARQISFCKDRLPALSSLTHFFEEVEENSGRYLAGLWESHLPGSLLWWNACGYRPEPEHYSGSMPPSWSWASTECTVRYPGLEFRKEDFAEVLDVRTYPSSVDPRGLVSGGHITLRAPLFPLKGTWEDRTNAWEEFLIYHSGSQSFDWCVTCSPDWPPKAEWSGDNDCYCVLDDPDSPELLLPNHVIGVPIFLLIIRTIYEPDPSEEGRIPYSEGYQFLGLVLKPLEHLDQIQAKAMENSESKLSFVRVGFGMMHLSEEDGEEALHRFGNTTVTIF